MWNCLSSGWEELSGQAHIPVRLENEQISAHCVARVPGLGTLFSFRIQDLGSKTQRLAEVVAGALGKSVPGGEIPTDEEHSPNTDY